MKWLSKKMEHRPTAGPILEREALDDATLKESLETLFQAMFHRLPDEKALDYYSSRYRSGVDFGYILLELAGSDEFGTWTKNRLFVPPGHFYSPIVDQKEAQNYFDRRLGEIPDEVGGVSIDRAAVLRLWHHLVPYMGDNPFREAKLKQFRYDFENPNFSYGDGSVWYAMLRHFKPRRVVEIGSGYSSACLIDTVEHYLQNDVEMTFVEPYPELLEGLIGEVKYRVRILANGVQDCDLNVFRELQAGDMLFIDSTHVLRTGSDVCFELFEVLPVLAAGVIIHIHDMFWPFEYPEGWVVKDNRSWNEIYAVRAFLTGNQEWKVIMFNDYMAKTAKNIVKETYPLFMKNPGGGLYLQKQDSTQTFNTSI